MPNDEPLAHSQRGNVSAQTYLKHITNVQKAAIQNACDATAYYHGDRDKFVGMVKSASLLHDLGKLDEVNQDVLKTNSRNPLPIPHEDAGVAALLEMQQTESAVLVAAHHAGLFSKSDEKMPNKKRLFRDERTPQSLSGRPIDEYVDEHLDQYLCAHESVGFGKIDKANDRKLNGCGFTRRIALSCLVDADHGDTAQHYGNEACVSKPETRWHERLAALERYVYGLSTGSSEQEKKRNGLRRKMFEACHDAPIVPSIRTCDAPVGSGKTTAVMANLLRVAAERNPQLRHIIVVLPYTNIITQSVEVYRKALVLEGERPEEIVAEHHHRADFSGIDLRQLATLWEAPIIVTTAVQFFETLGSHNTASLRKIHELPGSAVFIDEMHAAIPSYLWPQMWRWIETWTREWGGYIVLASGSLARFWELEEYNSVINGFNKATYDVPDLVEDASLRAELKGTEQVRIQYRRREENAKALDCVELVDFVVSKKLGPRLLIVNTVQTAAVIAKRMREAGHNVLHLSTALAPVHRGLVVERIKQRLRDKIDDWTLVATSCVEAGMDFSFRVGFRERSSTASLIQVGGRVSRGNEFADAEVWDLLLRDDQFSVNRSLAISRKALDNFPIDELNSLVSHELSTIAMRREWTSGAELKARQLIKYEEQMEYPSVAKECRVIDADTRTVLIDQSLAQAIQRGQRASKIEVMKYSVQMWANKISSLKLEPLFPENGSSDCNYYTWNYDYDPDFLGYMKGLLQIEDFISSGGAII